MEHPCTPDSFLEKKKKFNPDDYWEEKDKEDVARAKSFTDLLHVAMRILKRMPYPVGMVCGPISSGGKHSIEENLKAFNAWIDRLLQEGLPIFSQLPFEEAIFHLKNSPGYKGAIQLLEEFYLPIFESGHIDTLFFMPLWHTSDGAIWEYEQGERLGLIRVELDRLSTLKDFQAWVDDDWKERSGGAPNLTITITKFREETAEVIQAVAFYETGVTAKEHKDADIELELGDVMIQLATIANYYGFSLEEVANKAKRKIEKRHVKKTDKKKK